MPLEFAARTAAASLLRRFGGYDVLCGKGVYSARSTMVLWAGGFHHESDYVLVFFIDKIYFDFGNLPVPHAERHCRVNKMLQFIDSHGMVLAQRMMPKTALGRMGIVVRRLRDVPTMTRRSPVPAPLRALCAKGIPLLAMKNLSLRASRSLRALCG